MEIESRKNVRIFYFHFLCLLSFYFMIQEINFERNEKVVELFVEMAKYMEKGPLKNTSPWIIPNIPLECKI